MPIPRATLPPDWQIAPRETEDGTRHFLQRRSAAGTWEDVSRGYKQRGHAYLYWKRHYQPPAPEEEGAQPS